MRYEAVKDLSPKAFKRLTGVKPVVFGEMIGVLREAQRHKKSGRPGKLSLEDKVLLMLMYWREYRTQFHIAASYGVHEATACRIIRQTEDALVSSGQFSLPQRREVAEHDWVVVLVDATETRTERPKKTSGATTAARKSAIP